MTACVHCGTAVFDGRDLCVRCLPIGKENGARPTEKAPEVEEPSTWDEVDLAAVAERGGEPGPTMMIRTDKVALLYGAKIHAFNGEPEGGKSWAALAACVEQVRAGNHVIYVDFEDGATNVLERVRAFGLSLEDIVSRFHYIRPDEPLGAAEAQKLDAMLAKYGPTLVVFDGVTEAMVLQDLELKDGSDAARFIKLLPRRAARTGAAAVIIDHVVKDEEKRGRYAIGSQHKLAGIDVALAFEPKAPFGRGLPGVARIIVKKDRPGHLRAEALGAKRDYVAELHMTSEDGGGVVSIEFRAGEVDGAGFRPTCLMERLSRYLEMQPAPLSTNALLDSVEGQKSAKRQALAALVREEFVAVEQSGQSRLHRSIRRYREADDEGSKT